VTPASLVDADERVCPSTVIPTHLGGVGMRVSRRRTDRSVDLHFSDRLVAMELLHPSWQSRIRSRCACARWGSPTAPVLGPCTNSTGTDLLATGTFSPNQVPTSAGGRTSSLSHRCPPLAGGNLPDRRQQSGEHLGGLLPHLHQPPYTSFVDPNATGLVHPPPGLSGTQALRWSG